MNIYEKLGLSLMIIVSPVWDANMSGITGAIMLLFNMLGAFLFMLGDQIEKSVTRKS